LDAVVPVFHPPSPQTVAIAGLFSGLLLTLGAIFAIVLTLLFFAMIRYRRRAAAGAGLPRQIFGSAKLQLLWMVIPFLILCGLFAASTRTMASVDAPQNGLRTNDLVIIGRQWWWEARYPNGAMA